MLHVAFFKIRLGDRFPSPKRAFYNATRLGILELSPDKRCTFSGFDVEKLNNTPNTAVNLDGDASAKVIARNHESVSRLEQSATYFTAQWFRLNYLD